LIEDVPGPPRDRRAVHYCADMTGSTVLAVEGHADVSVDDVERTVVQIRDAKRSTTPERLVRLASRSGRTIERVLRGRSRPRRPGEIRAGRDIGLDDMVRPPGRIGVGRQREQPPDTRVHRVDEMRLTRVTGRVAERPGSQIPDGDGRRRRAEALDQ